MYIIVQVVPKQASRKVLHNIAEIKDSPRQELNAFDTSRQEKRCQRAAHKRLPGLLNIRKQGNPEWNKQRNVPEQVRKAGYMSLRHAINQNDNRADCSWLPSCHFTLMPSETNAEFHAAGQNKQDDHKNHITSDALKKIICPAARKASAKQI